MQGAVATQNQQTAKTVDLMSIMSSVQQDIKSLRTHLENIPPFPKDQAPPPQLARFQNNLDRIESNLVSSGKGGHKAGTISTGGIDHGAQKLPDICKPI
jgi:hypothetical protein